MERTDVIVLGAGAAGLFAAIEAARRGRRVVVLDHARRAGEKIRISGGGRCNFTNTGIAPERFLSANPRFALSALSRYGAQDFIARIDRAGIAWHEKTLGQLFCDGSARQIVDLLERDLAAAGGVLRLGTTISEVAPSARGWVVTTSGGPVAGGRVIVATGGRSIPKMGATGFGHDLARRFGLRLVTPRPGLVPLTFQDSLRAEMAALSGLAVAARIGCGKAGFEEGMLFTHRGLSGPSILQISNYWRDGAAITVDFLPGRDAGAALGQMRAECGRMLVPGALARLLPERLARQVTLWADVPRPDRTRVADLDAAALRRLAQTLGGWQVVPAGSEGYRTAEVTLGGVDTRDLDPRTMEARAVPGLHFIGEVVDVTGWLGGYNFQWAWSSGWVAGQAV